ncbi:YeeE/YedE family protein [Noviherbaspirillum sp.]|uniref:YeeE/YedE family protein n=1 Tax=Noviherbaspirillum sp. TaxID=1926288 RepID=UPI002B4A3036|nr:YeeE/YedE family protein [Noviherbaspirillum sp.]HJV83392.1 YeeE/YedE family protein [Noviherbaspirillum sp.]
MSIDWTHFTPLSALAGGLLIGLASALFALFNGRIAGVSGIVAGMLRPNGGDMLWRLAFVAGMAAAPLLYLVFSPLPEIRIDTGPALLMLAGLLVGIGTQYGSGCTSGHGVCGLSRLSPRSLFATMMFMAAGFATVYVVRHLLRG